jgi:hypothetical protein
MNTNRLKWNEDQKQLRRLLSKADDLQSIFSVFLTQHAKVHTASISGSIDWSYSDEVFTYVDEQGFRRIPPSGEHSIIWVIFHIARIEDITMNILLSGLPQIFSSQGWTSNLGTEITHAGNEMTQPQIIRLSQQINIDALLAYRNAVGVQTRRVVQQLQLSDLKRKVDPVRLQRVRQEGALLESAEGVYGYWSGLTAAGLLLMPPTRHNFYHIHECQQIYVKNKRS